MSLFIPFRSQRWILIGVRFESSEVPGPRQSSSYRSGYIWNIHYVFCRRIFGEAELIWSCSWNIIYCQSTFKKLWDLRREHVNWLQFVYRILYISLTCSSSLKLNTLGLGTLDVHGVHIGSSLSISMKQINFFSMRHCTFNISICKVSHGFIMDIRVVWFWISTFNIRSFKIGWISSVCLEFSNMGRNQVLLLANRLKRH